MAEGKPILRRETLGDELAKRRDLTRRLDGVIKKGRVEWVGTFEAAAGTTLTVVPCDLIQSTSEVSVQACDAVAATIHQSLYIDPKDYVAHTATQGGSFTARFGSPSVPGVFRYCVKG